MAGPRNNGADAIGVAALVLLQNIDARRIELTSSVKGDVIFFLCIFAKFKLKVSN